MNRISIYTLLVLIYLGLSKSFSPAEKSTPFVRDEKSYPSIFIDSPITAILFDTYSTGFIIKTHYHQYRVVHPLKRPSLVTVRVDEDYFEKTKEYIGLSLFAQDHSQNQVTVQPQPPGSIFIGNSAYGHWEMDNSGETIWAFHRAYRHFYDLFAWGDFRPTISFYEYLKLNNLQTTANFGPRHEFGTKGNITRLHYDHLGDMSLIVEEPLITHVKERLKNPFKREKQHE